MLVVGLTGGIGSGKTEVSNCFATLGVPIIDTDLLARELVQPGQPALEAIVAFFGSDCLDDQGNLRRNHLREQVFADPSGRHQLEAILHPRIRALIQARIAVLSTPYCLVAIPLLIESGMTQFVDRILVVDVTEEDQIRRVVDRDGVTREQAARILAAQASRSQRLSQADDVLDNSHDRDSLIRQIMDLHERYLALAATRASGLRGRDSLR
jgi:dephospho-CoA kinase